MTTLTRSSQTITPPDGIDDDGREIVLDKRRRIAKLASQSLIPFIQFGDPNYIVEDFHRYLASRLEAAERGETRRLIINVPPRHGKSRMVATEFPAWALGRNPSRKIITGSYGVSLAELHSKACRSKMRSDEFRMTFGTRVDPNDSSAKDWGTTQGGRYKAVGVEGDITGRGADILIIDDPHANATEAGSAVMRNKVWNWYLADAYSRLASDGIVIIIMTRWHTDDLVGRLIDPERARRLKAEGAEGEDWEVVKLPAVSGSNDVLAREEGEPLSPKRYPGKRLKNIRATLTGYMWSALYQQEPVQEGGNYIDPSKFNIIPKSPSGLEWVRYWDLATGDNPDNDYTAGIQGAVVKVPGETLDEDTYKLYLRWMRRGQWKWPRARGNMIQIAKREKCLVGVEAQGGFKTAYDNLREKMPRTILTKSYTVDKGKLTRALAWIAAQEDGQVFLCEEGDGGWIEDFKEECRQFPNGAHDDMVDAVSGVWAMLTTKQKKAGALFA